MNRLFLNLMAVFLSSSLLLAHGQGIRAAGDQMPVVRKTNTAGLPTTYTGRQIRVGNGGGVTGFSATYYLLENGKLYGRRSRDTSFTFIGQQTAANTRRVFSVAESKCKIKTANFDYPGNVYTFIAWKKGKQEHKVSWGAAGRVVPANYRQFYNSFMAMIPAASRLN